MTWREQEKGSYHTLNDLYLGPILVVLLLLLLPAVQVREEKGVCDERMGICECDGMVECAVEIQRAPALFLSLPSVVRLDDVPQPYPPALR